MTDRVRKAVLEFRKANGIPSGNKYKGIDPETIKAEADQVIEITLKEARNLPTPMNMIYPTQLQCNGFIDTMRDGKKIFYELKIE